MRLRLVVIVVLCGVALVCVLYYAAIALLRAM
jgi:hypothetical protein